jgi:hypothetical protein
MSSKVKMAGYFEISVEPTTLPSSRSIRTDIENIISYYREQLFIGLEELERRTYDTPGIELQFSPPWGK